jgi:thiol-disulfide isomerase/thioredoxin
MATQTESVVTPERYETGLSWTQWKEQIDRNQDKFDQNYNDLVLDQADVDAIKALMAKPGGPAKCLAIGEPWCPDVFRGMPVMAKLAEATGLDLKIFFRDLNLDIMNEFLNKGEFQSIPTFVFYTKDHKYLGHWIEKSQKTKDEAPIMQAITSKMRNPDISQEEREKYMAEYAAFQSGPVWGGWRTAQVKEIRELLEGAVK